MQVAKQAHILHVDMDAFFVQLEVNLRPQLEGKPVVVGGSGRRGVVAAASYEARAYGVFSAMPSVKAKQLCPDLIFLKGNLPLYAKVSQRIMQVMLSYTPDVEQISIDEAFLDVSGCEKLFGPPYEIAKQIRADVLKRESVRCSVGVGSTKLIAKLASREAKPIPSKDGVKPGLGVCQIAPEEEVAFLHPKPVSALFGVGPATQKVLNRLGVETVGDLAALPVATLVGALGNSHGTHVAMLARGIDASPVVSEHVEKSISHEITFPHNLTTTAELNKAMWQLAEKVGTRLRASRYFAKTVTIKVRYGDFATTTRRHTIQTATQSTQTIAQEALSLLTREDAKTGVRLLGVGVSGFTAEAPQQLTLDDVGKEPSLELEYAIDAIRARYGSDSIRRAVAGEGDFAPAPGFVALPSTVTSQDADSGSDVDLGPDMTDQRQRDEAAWADSGPDVDLGPDAYSGPDGHSDSDTHSAGNSHSDE